MRSVIQKAAVVAVLALTACAGGSQNVKVGGPQVSTGGGQKTGGQQTATTDNGQKADAVIPQVSARAKLYFEDGLKNWDAQKKKGQVTDYASIEKKFQQAAEEDGTFGEAWYNLGVLSERQGKTDAAVDYYQRALRAKPTLKQAAENLAVIQQNKGDVAGAVDIYQKILEVYPDDGPARARLAEIYRQNGEHERAIEMAREALVRDPKSLQAYKVLMLANLEKKQLSMAKLVALRALKIDENDPELYHTIGLILLQENEPAKARLQFLKAAEVRPDYQPAQVMLAKIALKSEDYVGAEEHLRRILQADGKNAQAMVDLGVAYKGQGQYDKAMQAYDAAEKLNPKLASVWFNRAVILGDQKKEYARAIELYKKFISVEGGESSVPADHAVFEQIKLNEQRIAKAEEEKRLAEEQKAAEAAALKEAERMEAEAKAAEEAAKREEEAAKKAADKGNAAKDAVGTEGQGKDVKPASAKEEPRKKEEKKEEPRKEEPKKEEPKKVAPPAKSSEEPSEEPADGL